MNSRPEITAMLSLSIQRHICPNNDPRIYWAREVTFDYAVCPAKLDHTSRCKSGHGNRQ